MMEKHKCNTCKNYSPKTRYCALDKMIIESQVIHCQNHTTVYGDYEMVNGAIANNLSDRITALEAQRVKDAIRILSLEGDKKIFLERLSKRVPFEVFKMRYQDVCCCTRKYTDTCTADNCPLTKEV